MRDYSVAMREALFEEYKQLSVSFDKHVQVSYSIPPVVLTIVTGFFFFSATASSSLIGFGVALGAVYLFIWLGLIHSMVNHLGVHLAELEIRISRTIDPNFDEVKLPLSFYRRFVAQTSKIVPGFNLYYVLLQVFVIAILVPASVRSWWTMTNWGWPIYIRVALVAIPPVLIVIVRLKMRHVDRITIAKMAALSTSWV